MYSMDMTKQDGQTEKSSLDFKQAMREMVRETLEDGEKLGRRYAARQLLSSLDHALKLEILGGHLTELQRVKVYELVKVEALTLELIREDD